MKIRNPISTVIVILAALSALALYLLTGTRSLPAAPTFDTQDAVRLVNRLKKSYPRYRHQDEALRVLEAVTNCLATKARIDFTSLDSLPIRLDDLSKAIDSLTNTATLIPDLDRSVVREGIGTWKTQFTSFTAMTVQASRDLRELVDLLTHDAWGSPEHSDVDVREAFKRSRRLASTAQNLDVKGLESIVPFIERADKAVTANACDSYLQLSTDAPALCQWYVAKSFARDLPVPRLQSAALRTEIDRLDRLAVGLSTKLQTWSFPTNRSAKLRLLMNLLEPTEQADSIPSWLTEYDKRSNVLSRVATGDDAKIDSTVRLIQQVEVVHRRLVADAADADPHAVAIRLGNMIRDNCDSFCWLQDERIVDAGVLAAATTAETRTRQLCNALDAVTNTPLNAGAVNTWLSNLLSATRLYNSALGPRPEIEQAILFAAVDALLDRDWNDFARTAELMEDISAQLPATSMRAFASLLRELAECGKLQDIQRARTDRWLLARSKAASSGFPRVARRIDMAFSLSMRRVFDQEVLRGTTENDDLHLRSTADEFLKDPDLPDSVRKDCLLLKGIADLSTDRLGWPDDPGRFVEHNRELLPQRPGTSSAVYPLYLSRVEPLLQFVSMVVRVREESVHYRDEDAHWRVHAAVTNAWRIRQYMYARHSPTSKLDRELARCLAESSRVWCPLQAEAAADMGDILKTLSESIAVQSLPADALTHVRNSIFAVRCILTQDPDGDVSAKRPHGWRAEFAKDTLTRPALSNLVAAFDSTSEIARRPISVLGKYFTEYAEKRSAWASRAGTASNIALFFARCDKANDEILAIRTKDYRLMSDSGTLARLQSIIKEYREFASADGPSTALKAYATAQANALQGYTEPHDVVFRVHCWTTFLHAEDVDVARDDLLLSERANLFLRANSGATCVLARGSKWKKNGRSVYVYDVATKDTTLRWSFPDRISVKIQLEYYRLLGSNEWRSFDLRRTNGSLDFASIDDLARNWIDLHLKGLELDIHSIGADRDLSPPPSPQPGTISVKDVLNRGGDAFQRLP